METQGGSANDVPTTNTDGGGRGRGRGRRLKAASPLRANRPGALVSKQREREERGRERSGEGGERDERERGEGEKEIIRQHAEGGGQQQDSGGNREDRPAGGGAIGIRRGENAAPPTRPTFLSGSSGDNQTRRGLGARRGTAGEQEEDDDEEEEEEEDDDDDEETDSSDDGGNPNSSNRTRRKTLTKDKDEKNKATKEASPRVWARRKKRSFTPQLSRLADSSGSNSTAAAASTTENTLPPYPNPNGENYGVVIRPGDNKRYTRCRICCLYKVQVPSKKDHVCREDLIGHTWEQCPTKNKRTHMKEQQERPGPAAPTDGARRGESIVLRKTGLTTQRLQQSRGKMSWFNLQRRRNVLSDGDQHRQHST